ncbi:MAG: glycosyltransferase family A protein [Eggerthellaceae bacterium]
MNSNYTKLFTIGVPAYNAERYLPECLESLTEQTLSDFKIVIIDDGSTDRTGEICDRFCHAHDNAIVVHKTNQGVALARRDIIQRADSSYVIFLDADDCLSPNTIAHCSIIAKQFNYPDIITFDYSVMSDFSSPIRSNSLDYGLHEICDLDAIRKALCAGEFNNLCMKAIRINLLSDSIAKDQRLIYSEDLHQMIFAIEHVRSLYCLGKPLYFYRQNLQSNTKNYNPQYLKDLKTTLSTLLEKAKQWGLEEYAEKGSLLQACYLASIAVSDENLPKPSKESCLVSIGATIKELGISRSAMRALRPDLRAVVSSMTNGNGIMAKVILQVHLIARKLLHRI